MLGREISSSQCSSHFSTVHARPTFGTRSSSRSRSKARTLVTTVAFDLLMTCRRSRLPSSLRPTVTRPCQYPSLPR